MAALPFQADAASATNLQAPVSTSTPTLQQTIQQQHYYK